MPEMDTAAWTIEKAGPDERQLQSNTELLPPAFEPMMLTNGELLLMTTLGSLKYAAERYTKLAFREWIAYAMVWQGKLVLHTGESNPVEGFTATDKPAPSTPWRKNAPSRMVLANDATRYERITDERSIAFTFV